MPAKKTSRKKSTAKRKRVKKTLKKAKPENSFYLIDGKVCKDLIELSHALDDAAHEVFEHHVNDFKNDFAEWVEHVMDEKLLAKTLRNTKSKDRHVIEVMKVVIRRK